MSYFTRYFPERIPLFDAVGGDTTGGTRVYGDVRTEHPLNTDSFGKFITDGVQNRLDIASQYSFSPERLRLFKDGTRQFVQYNTITGFTDASDTWTLAPAGGETFELETAESLTYVVNYVAQTSTSFELNQELSEGDHLRVGNYTSSNGWFFEQRGSDHTASQVDLIERRDGTRTVMESDVELPRPTTDWTRHQLEFNWYNVGNQIWTQTYTVDGEQRNEVFARTSIDGERGPSTANVPNRYEIHADASTSGLELRAGSTGAVVLGDPTTLARSKPQAVELNLPNTDDTWLPQYAIRLNPNNPNVNAALRNLEILDYGNQGFLEMVAVSFDSSKTSIPDGDWELPDYHHAQNSAIQEAYAGDDTVYDVANDSGVVGTLGSGEKFGGFTLESASLAAGGNTIATFGEATSAVEQKNPILESDVVVFLVRTNAGGASLRFTWSADQDW